MKRCLSTGPSATPRRPLLAPVLPRTAPSAAENTRRLSPTTLHPSTTHVLPEVWFNASFPLFGLEPSKDEGKPPDERTIRLGKTLRILQERLPTLLQSPLPSDILSPNISLHLFPSTHPHLPVVSGRVAYIAALWTSPLAWNRVPIVGNVRLEILSERMAKQPLHAAPRRAGAGDEQLVVRWRTIGAAKAAAASRTSSSGTGVDGSVQSDGTIHPLSKNVDPTKEFTGLFIFEFDQQGRILSHTIEHVEEGGDWERSVGARFVALTDWLLGGMRGGGSPPVAAFAPQDLHKLR